MRVTTVLLWAFIVFILFTHLDEHQLEYYDEARRGVNALEMSRGMSHFLVPTYAGESDWWGTKPPLLIWLQTVFLWLFGEGILAIRLPAALASVALTGLLAYWAKREWGSHLVGLLAAVIVFSSQDYLITHGARSGDYDSLLILFLTAQVVCAHRWVSTGKDKFVWLLGLAVLLAGYTKGIAGGFFLPAIGCWLLVTRAGRRQLLRYPIYVSVASAIAAVVGYYFMREVIDPGFLVQVAQEEWGGRFYPDKPDEPLRPLFYLQRIGQDWAFNTFLVLAPLGIFWHDRGRGSATHPAYLSAIVTVVFLLVISLASTKLYWYKGPALPQIALLAAVTLYRLARAIEKQRGVVPAVLALALVFGYPMAMTLDTAMHPKDHYVMPYHKHPFQSIMADPNVQPPYTMMARGYNPDARFEVMLKNDPTVTLGHSRNTKFIMAREARTQVPTFTVGDRLVVCHEETWTFIDKGYRVSTLYERAPCKLLRIDAVR